MKFHEGLLTVITTIGAFRLWSTRRGSSFHTNNHPQNRFPSPIFRSPRGTRLSKHEARLNPYSFRHSITYRYPSFLTPFKAGTFSLVNSLRCRFRSQNALKLSHMNSSPESLRRHSRSPSDLTSARNHSNARGTSLLRRIG